MIDFDYSGLPTPYYAVDESALIHNLEILKRVIDSTECKILLAQKCYSMYSTYPLLSKYLSGTTASGLYEARLGKECFGKETHIFSPCYTEEEFSEVLKYSDHMIFNSVSQWRTFGERAIKAGKECGIRVNPEYSTQEHAIYDPCAYGSRFGVTLDNYDEQSLKGISGIHFHTLCEQNVDPLIRTLEVVEQKFGKYISGLKWVNFGGGHHITRVDYDVDRLIDTINKFKAKHNVQVYLEPGEAVALNAGYLVATVHDIVHNGIDIAILDTSASCHMPDVLEMPYRPNIFGSGIAGEKEFTYRLGAYTCLSGDIIGDYSFDKKLIIGDKLIFLDMAIYSMVKNNTFNGMKLPSLAIVNTKRELKLIKSFGYEDFKNRLS